MKITDPLASVRALLGFRLVSSSKPKRRQRRPGLLHSVAIAEERVLLSGASAADDTMLVEYQDVAVEMDVLANDSSDSGALAIVSASTPTHGTLTVIDGNESAGERDRLLFTPEAGYTGPQVFSYTIDDGLGNQDTATVQIIIGQPSTQPTGGGTAPVLPNELDYQLSNGFRPGADVTFEHTATGSYSFTDADTSSTTTTYTDTDGVEKTKVEALTSTLIVSSVANTDGTWSYDETLTTTFDVQINGVDGSAEHQWGSFSYTFISSGDSTSSEYAVTATAADHRTEDYAEAWSQVEGDTMVSGSRDFHDTETETRTDTISHWTHADGSASGERTTGGSTSYSSSGGGGLDYGEGTYAYPIEGSDVGGTDTIRNWSGGSYQYALDGSLPGSGSSWSWGSGIATLASSGGTSYSSSGSGTYTRDINGGTIVGTTGFSTYHQ